MSIPAKEQKFFIEGPSGKLEVKSVLISEITEENNVTKKEDPTTKEKNSKKIGIICHPHPLYQGSMDNKVVTTIARAWQNLGLSTLRFNFRGVGQSEGKYSDGVGELDDLLAVQAWVEQHYPEHALWLSGFSFGSYIAAKAAVLLQEKVQALLSIAPPVHHFSFNTLGMPDCPWIIIQGDADEVVPCENVVAWYKDFKERQNSEQTQDRINLKIMKGASHFFHGRLVELKTEIIQLMSHI